MKLNRLIPMLPVRSIASSIPFYEKLGFEVERRQDDWWWAMMRWDECRIMLDQSIHHPHPIPRLGVIYLYPENIAEYHATVRQRGLIVPDLETTFYGMTEFRIEDPDGNRLWIGETLSD
jgi:catechol 2,3-dioxygenase-like lactoylglutathione lyase family enzyme